MNLFNLDSPFMQFLTKIADLLILNLLFIISCIPIVTIGTANIALYTVTLKAAKNEESYIVRGYLKAFKNNFKIGTITWLLVLLVGFILFADFMILPGIPSPFGRILQVLTLMIFILYILMLTYLFPYIARFENSVFGSLKNALLLAIVHFPYSLLFIAITVLAFVASVFINFGIVSFVWAVIGFSGLAYINSTFFRKIFVRYEENPAEPKEDDTSCLQDGQEEEQQ